MSAVSIPIPITRTRRRTIRFGSLLGACLSCSRRAFSICRICNELLALDIALQFGERVGRNGRDRRAVARLRGPHGLARRVEAVAGRRGCPDPATLGCGGE